MKTNRPVLLAALLCPFVWLPYVSTAQFSYPPFNPTTNTVIDMSSQPDGIYRYGEVNIPNGVTVSFIPNASNTPVVWLVDRNCVIHGTVDISGKEGNTSIGAPGGPGGYRGGNGGTSPSSGQGPGGGAGVVGNAGSGSFGSLGRNISGTTDGAGAIYGNIFLVPLVGGSGGGGGRETGQFSSHYFGGGGGGGALLISAAQEIQLHGNIYARGGQTRAITPIEGVGSGGGGSGGAVRLVAARVTGAGIIDAGPGPELFGGSPITSFSGGGLGRVRLDSPDLNFGGTIIGVSSQGNQPIVLPTPGNGLQLVVSSVAGVPVSASPSGNIATPDSIISAQQNNPIPIVVQCYNVPLNTQITVTVKPANAPGVSAIGLNSTGTLSSSTATVLINMPRGGGLIYASIPVPFP